MCFDRMEFTRILRLHGLRPKNERRISMKKHPLLRTALLVMTAAALLCVSALAVEDGAPANSMYGTFWALVPPVIAITLALITKEAYSSLFIGVTVGALFSQGFSPIGALNMIVNDGLVAAIKDNAGIFLFLVLLGIIVALVNAAGGSAAFGRWASKNIKTKVGASLATFLLGILIFIDDYFNCLTVGSVMRPVTDSHKVSRAKLSYLIDATAAPICIIAPISSWAAAVSGFVEGEDGFSIFVRAIPYNYYALFTIAMMILITVWNFDYGPMAKYETNALKGDLFSDSKEEKDTQRTFENPNGRVLDLILPVLVLIVCCVLGMLYSGGFFSGVDFVSAFAGSDASVGLALGSIFALLLTILYYCLRRIMSFQECCDCLPYGFKAMVPAILILTFAWTLKAMTDSLGAADFVAGTISQAAGNLMALLPAIIFLIGAFLAFATGTSWGTFGILIPIVVNVFSGTNHELMIISISACMAGAVCGDHCSPISDTTIMASAGAQCEHVNHVSTQLPYAMVAAAVSFLTYIIAGFVQTAWIALPAGIVLMAITLVIIRLKFDDLKM